MKVYIDADGCPVVREAEIICKKYNLPLIIFCDSSHIISSDYANIITVGTGADAVDFALVNKCQQNDIVITQDYGLAAMVLSKGCKCINQNGLVYTDDNISGLLDSRYIAKKIRNSSSKHHLKGPAKRTASDNKRFIESFEKILDIK